MAQPFNNQAHRYAVVTGANKGIGLEICRQLASSKGTTVILTSRDKDRGFQALQRLKNEFGLTQDNLVFHQLDVLDLASIDALVHFIQINYGKLDILVNNAGITGVGVEGDDLVLQQQIEEDIATILSIDQANGAQVKKANGKLTETLEDAETCIRTNFYGAKRDIATVLSIDQANGSQVNKANGKLTETLEDAETCIRTNFYGAKRVTAALIPLLQLSDRPTIVNVSSTLGSLRLLCNEWGKQVLSNEEQLTEERVDQVVEEFLKNLKEGSVEANGWPGKFAAYKVSKAALNGYTRTMAKKHPEFCVNCLCPGFARTDITHNQGPLSAGEAAENVVALALLADGGPSGLYFCGKQVIPF